MEPNMESARTDDKPNSKQNGKKRNALWIIIGAAAVIIAITAGILIKNSIDEQNRQTEAQRQAIIQSGVYHDGITVNGVEIGGMNPKEAAQALKAAEAKIESGINLTLHAEGNAFPVHADAFHLSFNTDKVLKDAMAIGREGSLEELQAELADIAANKRKLSISYTADRGAIESFVNKLAEQIDRAPADAHFKVLVDKSALTPEQLKDEKTVVQLSATTHEERLTYVEDVNGITLDRAALVDALINMAKNGAYMDMDIPLTSVRADITLDNITDKIVLRASAFTSFAKSPYNRASRVFNLQKAAGLINGTILQPGEVFSTNDTLGHRTFTDGWKAAPAIVRGRTEDQAGGGVCQVSTTLYLSVLKADLEVVYRQGHSGRLGYINGGLDATIDSGRIDFKWKNNTKSPLYLFAWVDTTQKQIHFEIYGEPLSEEYDEIRLSSEKVDTIDPPGETTYTIDYTKPSTYKEVYVARKSGSIYESYKTYVKNGITLKTVPITTTRYDAYAGETIIGPPAAQPVYGPIS